MSKKTYGIYAIRNIHSSKLYIGSTILSFQKRWALHRSELRRGAHSNRHLQHAWNQDGEASFQFEILEEISDKSLALQREQFWLDQYKIDDLLYNHLTKATNWVGYSHSDESKQKIASSKLGSKMSQEAKDQMRKSKQGVTLSQDHKDHISKSRKGIVFSEEHKSNLSKSCSGDKHRNFGKTIPDDVKIKISRAQKGRVFTEEHKRKLSESAKKRCSKEVVE